MLDYVMRVFLTDVVQNCTGNFTAWQLSAEHSDAGWSAHMFAMPECDDDGGRREYNSRARVGDRVREGGRDTHSILKTNIVSGRCVFVTAKFPGI